MKKLETTFKMKLLTAIATELILWSSCMHSSWTIWKSISLKPLLNFLYQLTFIFKKHTLLCTMRGTFMDASIKLEAMSIKTSLSLRKLTYTWIRCFWCWNARKSCKTKFYLSQVTNKKDLEWLKMNRSWKISQLRFNKIRWTLSRS